MEASACILGCQRTELASDEKKFFRDADPWGFILFSRNIESPEQLRRLTGDLRQTTGRDTPILIDQEGGRVARLRSPHWREFLPPLEQMARVAPQDRRQAMALRYRLIAHELRALGIDVNCAPMLDIACDTTHAAIRNRCYGRDADTVADTGRAVAEGLLAGGVLPIIKHIPGHGRTPLDSHHDLPVVDAPLAQLQATDFAPFARLSDLPMAMTAHIIYRAIDPEFCATHSSKVIAMIRTDIGFDGLLMTDDLSMHALGGSFQSRAEKALAAGCDLVLHCNGDKDEMTAVMMGTPRLSQAGAQRAKAALVMRSDPAPFEPSEADRVLTNFLKGSAHA